MTSPLSHLSTTTWGVHFLDSTTGRTLFSRNPDQMMKTASVPKLLLLVAAAHLHLTGDLDLKQQVTRTGIPPVGGTGIWQHLTQDTLPLTDVLHLIGTASDNLATNVFLQTLRLDTVHDICRNLNIRDVQLHDIIRSQREPHHPPTVSTATARGLANLMHRIANDKFQEKGTGPLVAGWLTHFLDHSMVAAAFHHNPLNPNSENDTSRLLAKTGTDHLVRAEAGWVEQEGRQISYAVIANNDTYDRDTPNSQFTTEVNAGLAVFKRELSIQLLHG